MEREKRTSMRQRCLIGVKAVAPGGYQLVNCTIRDISDSGAFLKSDAPGVIPREGYLRFGDGRPDRPYRVVHGRKGGVGIAFIAPPTEPAAASAEAPVTEVQPVRLAETTIQKLRAQFAAQQVEEDRAAS
jgi:hypothetical protein